MDFNRILSMIFNTKDESKRFDPDDMQKGRIWAMLSYVWFLCLVPIFVSDSKFAGYHARQGVVLAVCETVVLLVLRLLCKIPILGIVFWIIWAIVLLAAICMSALGIYNAYCFKAKQLPFIGGYAPKN
ncbi:MAG: hypothetical protein K5663_10150 [Clostridiales bacterium]|nr:hypothetical protein [Clostridiales bacterium]